MDEVIVFYYPVTDPAHHPRGTMDPQTLTTVGTGAVLLAAIIGALTYARQSSRDLRTDLKTDINQARVELKADINQIRTDLKNRYQPGPQRPKAGHGNPPRRASS